MSYKDPALAISTYFVGGYDKRRLEVFKKSLSSLFESKFTGKVIIVDDGSDEKDHIHWLKNENKKVTIIEKDNNGGISKTKNTSIKQILKYSNVGFLCDDDIFYKNGFDNAYVDSINKTGIEHFSAFVVGNCQSSPVVINKHTIIKTSLLNGCFVTITKSMIDKIGYYPILPHKYGHEHVNFTKRCIQNKFAPFFCDIVDREKFINIVHESGLCSAIGYKVNAPENKYKLNENSKIAFSDYSYKECVE